MYDITKVVIPAAGFGTRFLPATKAIPKEMLPLLNKPSIQYVVEEALNSYVETFLMITSDRKDAIASHFDTYQTLEAHLRERGVFERVASIEKIMRNASFAYFRQAEQQGLGHAVWCARHAIQKEYFGVCLPDDIIDAKEPALSQLIRVARQEKASVIAVQEVPSDCVSSYGVIAVKKQITPNLFKVGQLIEKPKKQDAPSNLAVIGRYVLSHKIFPALEAISADEKGEIQLTDAISSMLKNNEKVFAYKVQGTRYDVGTPVGWIKAIIGLGLQHPEYGPHIKKFITDVNTTESYLFDPRKTIEHQV